MFTKLSRSSYQRRNEKTLQSYILYFASLCEVVRCIGLRAHIGWRFNLCVSYRVFNCILVHFIPLPVFIFYSFTGIYILLILFLYSILSTLFPCTLYGLIFPFLYFYSIFVYSFSLFSVPAWMGLYRRGWDYTAWSVFV